MAEPSTSLMPIKIGVKYKPPTLVLVYVNHLKNARKRTMPVRHLTKHGDARKFSEELKERHKDHLADVPLIKIDKMIRLLQENMKGNSHSTALEVVEKEFTIDANENMNALDDKALRRRKELMDESFELNRKKPGDPDFEYDVRVDFNQDPNEERSPFDSEDEGSIQFPYLNP